LTSNTGTGNQSSNKPNTAGNRPATVRKLIFNGIETLLVTGNHLLSHGPQLSSVFIRHMGAWTLHWPPTLFAPLLFTRVYPAPAVVLTRVRRDGVVEDAEESGLCATPCVYHASHHQDGLQHGVCAAVLGSDHVLREISFHPPRVKGYGRHTSAL